MIPPEILTLIPDFWHGEDDSHLTALTHVCRAWREMFTSRSSLWARLDCENAEKTRVYLERSKSSPIDLSLHRDECLLPCDPFFEIDCHAVERLVSLEIRVSPECLQDITPRLSHPAPLLENLAIEVDRIPQPEFYHAITTTLFDGNISLLRELSLHCIRTDLPWRNMANLTSFTLTFTPPGEISTTQLLDFFESAPHLQKVELLYVSPASVDQHDRLVSLMCLKELLICDDQPAPPFIGHISIPVGASLRTEIASHSRIEDHLPRSLINLRNLPDPTQLRLSVGAADWDIEFVGPNGRLRLISFRSLVHPVRLVPEFLDWFNTSTIEVLEIVSRDLLHQSLACRLLLPMRALRTLTISSCITLHHFIHALNPDVNSGGVLVCPRLEKLVLHTGGERGLDIEGMEAARESRGAKLKSVQIVDGLSDEED